jgi:hypothetical protein
MTCARPAGGSARRPSESVAAPGTRRQSTPAAASTVPAAVLDGELLRRERCLTETPSARPFAAGNMGTGGPRTRQAPNGALAADQHPALSGMTRRPRLFGRRLYEAIVPSKTSRACLAPGHTPPATRDPLPGMGGEEGASDRRSAPRTVGNAASGRFRSDFDKFASDIA